MFLGRDLEDVRVKTVNDWVANLSLLIDLLLGIVGQLKAFLSLSTAGRPRTRAPLDVS